MLLARRLSQASEQRMRHSLCLSKTTLGQERPRARVVNLGNHSRIVEVHEEVTGAVEMLVSILVSCDREEEITKISLDTSERAHVSRLLIVETRRRVFDQGAVEIVFSVFRGR